MNYQLFTLNIFNSKYTRDNTLIKKADGQANQGGKTRTFYAYFC